MRTVTVSPTSAQRGHDTGAWLRAAAHQRLEEQQRSGRFESPAELAEFFRKCDALEGPGVEPDWEEHLAVINASRSRGSGT